VTATPSSEAAPATAALGLRGVLFIAGWGRSGTTLVDNLVGQLPGFFSTGELRYVWARGILQDYICGCGQPVRTCPVWSAVLDRLSGTPAGDARHMAALQEHLRIRQLPVILRMVRSGHLTGPYAEYAAALRDLYAAVSAVTGAEVIVDSSKFPADAAIASALQGVDTHVLHMVRDPRAVAYSWSKQKSAPGSPGGYLWRTGPVHSSLNWAAANLALRAGLAPRLGDRYQLLRYEDFVAAPRQRLVEVVERIGGDSSKLPFIDDATVTMATTHAVSGNPRRFSSGSTSIAADTAWIAQMPAKARWLATLPAAPLMPRYRYPVTLPNGPATSR
jgi:hypothetical protein